MTCSKQCLQTYPNFWATLAWQFRGSTIQIAQWIGETWLWIGVNWTLSNSGKMNLPKKDMTSLHVRWYCRGFPELLSFEKKKRHPRCFIIKSPWISKVATPSVLMKSPQKCGWVWAKHHFGDLSRSVFVNIPYFRLMHTPFTVVRIIPWLLRPLCSMFRMPQTHETIPIPILPCSISIDRQHDPTPHLAFVWSQFQVSKLQVPKAYPLVNVYITMGNHHVE